MLFWLPCLPKSGNKMLFVPQNGTNKNYSTSHKETSLDMALLTEKCKTKISFLFFKGFYSAKVLKYKKLNKFVFTWTVRTRKIKVTCSLLFMVNSTICTPK